MSGLRVAALYGVYPFLLGLCGPQGKSKKKILLDYVSEKKVSEKEVRKLLEQFKGAFPYYKFVAKNNGIKDPFNEKVVKAYWIGNKLLDKAPKAHHSFHVFVVGSVTGTIELKGKLLDVCRIGWGEVVKKKEDKVVIKYQPIRKSKNKYFLGDLIEKTIFWDKELVPNVKIGDKVSVHWNHLIQILGKQDLANLRKYTNLTLKSMIE